MCMVVIWLCTQAVRGFLQTYSHTHKQLEAPEQGARSSGVMRYMGSMRRTHSISFSYFFLFPSYSQFDIIEMRKQLCVRASLMYIGGLKRINHGARQITAI